MDPTGPTGLKRFSGSTLFAAVSSVSGSLLRVGLKQSLSQSVHHQTTGHTIREGQVDKTSRCQQFSALSMSPYIPSLQTGVSICCLFSRETPVRETERNFLLPTDLCSLRVGCKRERVANATHKFLFHGQGIREATTKHSYTIQRSPRTPENDSA